MLMQDSIGGSAKCLMFVTCLARHAQFKEFSVSSALDSAGDTFTNMRHLALPPMLSCMSIVSLWFRYGACLSFLDTSAAMTSPRALSDLLISTASFKASPSTPDFFGRSDPARSHNVILP